MKVVKSNIPLSGYHTQNGFGLIEIIIVVLVTTIICVAAIPQMTVSLRNNRVNTINSAIASKLSEARIQAIKRNSQCSFVVNTQTRKMWIESGGVMIGGAENYPSEIQIQFSPAATGNIQTTTFNSFGYLATTPPTINVGTTAVNLKKSVSVSLSGKITVGQMIIVSP